ncbi:MAG: 4-hydroxythreonine-4-phosphate dehydrogenase PdxA [Beijerinckiaceae bacterium]
MNSLSPIALTMGEPAGIGPEITLAAWQALRAEGPAFAVLADPALLRATAKGMGLSIPVAEIGAIGEASGAFRRALPVLAMPLPAVALPGRPSAETAQTVIASIERAVALARAGEASAVVTNPIQKSVLTSAGFGFPGHTEFLESLAGLGHRARMMLVGEGLRVALVTIHEPLRQSIARLDRDLIVEAGRDAAAGLRRDFGIDRPRIAVAGLNPHAGEDGTMGREEADFIAPAVAALRSLGIDAFGPLPPDTMFTPAARAGYDAALCLYHDQGLIPLKTLDMMGGVNVTLGLPFVRTSPDHGTALDIAGRGQASASSLIAALRMAADIARVRLGAREAA